MAIWKFDSLANYQHNVPVNIKLYRGDGLLTLEVIHNMPALDCAMAIRADYIRQEPWYPSLITFMFCVCNTLSS